MNHPLTTWVGVAGLVAVSASAASAQGYRPERPFRGLFGSGVGETEQSLTANASLGGGFDNNVVADALFGNQPRISDVNTPIRGGVGQATGSLSYALNLSRVTFSATGATTLHYYPSLGSELLKRYYGDVGASVRVTRDIAATAAVTYTPYSLNSLFPFDSARADVLPAPDIDLASSLEHYFAYSGGIGYNRRLSRRTVLSADYSVQQRDETAFTPGYLRNSAGGVLRFELGRGLALRGGYHFTDADYGSGGRKFQSHLIDAGVDYSRALSFSRRTTLTFNTGTVATSNPESPTADTSYRLVGGARLSHEMGRSWFTGLAYDRGVHFDAGWGDMVTSDGVSASLGGLISRRVQFDSSVRASTGSIGFAGAGNGFDSYYGSASLGYALNRHVNVGLTYGYYRHHFDQDVAVPSDFARSFNRHSVRLSLNMWAPIFQRARRPNATR